MVIVHLVGQFLGKPFQSTDAPLLCERRNSVKVFPPQEIGQPIKVWE